MKLDIIKKTRVSTPVFLQMEATECGAASLGIICAYHKLYLPLEKLRIECGVSRDGSNAVNIVRAARRLGFEAKGYRYSAETLREKETPFIIHWNFNHFVVLEGFKDDKVYINDPAAGHRTVLWSEFETSYTGVTLKLNPGPDFQKGGSEPNAARSIYKWLKTHKTALFFAVLTELGLIAPGLAIPIFTQIFFDDILGKNYTGWMFNILLAMGITVILQGGLVKLRAWCLLRWQRTLSIGDSSRFFWHLIHLPVEFFQQRYVGQVVSRIPLNDSVAAVLAGQAATAILDLVVALAFLALLWQYDATLTVIGVFFSLINVTILYLMVKWLKEEQMKIQQYAGKSYGVAVAGVQTIETLKANGNEGDFFAKWAGYQSKFLDAMERVEMSTQLFMLAPSLIAALNTAAIMAVGGFKIMDGLMTAGIFFAFQNLMGHFQEPLNKLLNLSISLQTTQTQMYHLDDVFSYPKDKSTLENENPAASSLIEGGKLYGCVELKNITFGYSHLEEALIENFNLVLNPGDRVALVGSSGSGKSTLAKIVTGMYQPWSGEILFDSIPRSQIPRGIIANSLSSVDQEIFLFEGTVSENISLFDATASRQEIVAAAKDAVIHDDISLQGGYESKIEEGGRNLSGGQRQRMEIARALSTNPSILVLDEATSALDPLTEQEITDNIRRRGCACLIVAHRLSTIRDCDEIIVMEYGKIVQRGTHEKMINVEGPYRSLILHDESETALGGSH